MRTRSKILSKAISCVLLVALALIICVPVTAATNSTTLTTTVPETLSLSVEMRGCGTVIVDGTEYTESSVVQTARNKDIVLQIIPDDGWCIKSVVWGGNDITEKAKAGNVTLPGINEETAICVEFEKTASTPATGDTFSSAYVAFLMVISIIGIALTVYLKNTIYEK